MLGSLLKVLAYRQAPKTTFAMLHPDAAFQIAKMRYDFHHAYAPRVAAVAAAAVALPLGIILGRAFERGARRRQASGGTGVRAGAGRGGSSIPAGAGRGASGRVSEETRTSARSRQSAASTLPARSALSPRSIRSQVP